MKIVILAGGLSPEREVSLSSGSLIANSLMKSGHAVALVDVYLGVRAPEQAVFRTEGEYRHVITDVEPDLEALKRESGNGAALIGPGVIELCRSADLTFLALHGGMGENGQLQATLDTFGIKYTGSGYIGCLLAMDKGITKELLRHASLPTPPGITVRASAPDAVDTIRATVGLPCVVKPSSCGSSVGVSIVEDESALRAALAEAARWEDSVLVEEKIVGREFSIGILDGVALPPIEIIPLSGFYDYRNKYQSGMTKEICPADLTEEQNQALASASEAVFRVLRLEGYSRIDFILSERDGLFYCLEANALPGMTPTSLLPQEAAAAGIGYDALCERIAMMALEK